MIYKPSKFFPTVFQTRPQLEQRIAALEAENSRLRNTIVVAPQEPAHIKLFVADYNKTRSILQHILKTHGGTA